MKFFWLAVTAVILLTVIGGGYYFLPSGSPPSSPSPSPSPLLPSNIPLPTTNTQVVPDSWETYTSEPQDFTIRHPDDIEIQSTPEGEQLIKLGPTQSVGTQLTDGLSLSIRRGFFENNQTLNQMVRAKHEQMKQEPTTNSITEIEPVLYGPLQGYKFRKTSLGEADYIYFQKSQTEYIEVINNTVEPENSQSNFKGTADLIISSLEF